MDSMEQHLQQIEDQTDRLASVRKALAEKLTVAIILSSLLESYKMLIKALETRPKKALKQELVKKQATRRVQ